MKPTALPSLCRSMHQQTWPCCSQQPLLSTAAWVAAAHRNPDSHECLLSLLWLLLLAGVQTAHLSSRCFGCCCLQESKQPTCPPTDWVVAACRSPRSLRSTRPSSLAPSWRTWSSTSATARWTSTGARVGVEMVRFCMEREKQFPLNGHDVMKVRDEGGSLN